MTDDVDMRRRRALYRAQHRGTKEMDHMIGRFAEAKVPQLEGEDLGRFERFLELPDPLLHAWCFDARLESGGTDAPEFLNLVLDVRAFHGLDATARTNG
jgi:antitoxin CptB